MWAAEFYPSIGMGIIPSFAAVLLPVKIRRVFSRHKQMGKGPECLKNWKKNKAANNNHGFQYAVSSFDGSNSRPVKIIPAISAYFFPVRRLEVKFFTRHFQLSFPPTPNNYYVHSGFPARSLKEFKPAWCPPRGTVRLKCTRQLVWG